MFFDKSDWCTSVVSIIILTHLSRCTVIRRTGCDVQWAALARVMLSFMATLLRYLHIYSKPLAKVCSVTKSLFTSFKRSYFERTESLGVCPSPATCDNDYERLNVRHTAHVVTYSLTTY